jgi:hypothetical protein
MKYKDGSKFYSQRNRYRNLIRSSADFRTFAEVKVGIPIGENAIQFEFVERFTLHIRRGDFVQVATHLVGHQTYINFLRRIEHVLPFRIIIFSELMWMSTSKRDFWMNFLIDSLRFA